MDSLSGKVVIVTGSSSGIGRATAVSFAKHRSKVVLTGRREEALQEAVSECVQQGANPQHIAYVKADISTDTGVKDILDKAISQFEKLDVLVNNAGIAYAGGVQQTTMQQYDATFNTNLRSVFQLTQLAIPHLKKTKGSSSGIGRATAVSFAKHRSKVVLTGRREEALQEAVSECVQQGANPQHIAYVKADISTDTGVKDILDKAISQFEKLDVLVNNAGIAYAGGVQQTTMQQYDATFNTNLRSVFQLTQLAIPHLKKTKGCVVNVSSLYSYRASTEAAAYCMTKAALDMFTDTLALELGPDGVRVNSVNPGEIKTPMASKFGVEDLDEYYKEVGAQHPLKRVGEASEVASVITFLASDGASFMTGSKVPVDGGWGLTSSWFKK